ncbi:tetratricopeptide repeat protein [Pseudoroseomonas globiformis]|uniref:Tetratricopeptide repeat protein n=1 Tax=Teichococcus globiformis TaxID=2307229 RepID=A0ABV7G2V5_9PROT
MHHASFLHLDAASLRASKRIPDNATSGTTFLSSTGDRDMLGRHRFRSVGRHSLNRNPFFLALSAFGAKPAAMLRTPSFQALTVCITLAVASLLPTAHAQTPPSRLSERAEVGRLLDALPTAPDEVAAFALESRIRALWAQAASPAVGLLLSRAQRNLQAEAPADALEDLDAALTLDPAFAEAWLLRAQAQIAVGDHGAALKDLRQALAQEPRHFGALVVLSNVQEQAGDAEGALRSMREALAIHPRMSGGQERLRRLTQAARGQAI